MHEELWAGVELKLQHAQFHFDKMDRALQPPEQTWTNVVQQSGGAIPVTNWHRSFYALFDAFLSAARSVAWIIQCCFGVDPFSRRPGEMQDWFDKLCDDEKKRRQEFDEECKAHYDRFRALRLSTVRNVGEHRTGIPAVKVTISGRFGVTYFGSPTESVPISETRQFDDPDHAVLFGRRHPIQPTWDDFEIEDKPLYPACQEYLHGARALVTEARRIALRVHGPKSLSLRRPKSVWSDHICIVGELMEMALEDAMPSQSASRYGRFTVIDGGVH